MALSQFRIQKLPFLCVVMLKKIHLHEHFCDFNRLRRTKTRKKSQKTFSFIIFRSENKDNFKIISHLITQDRRKKILLLNLIQNLEIFRGCRSYKREFIAFSSNKFHALYFWTITRHLISTHTYWR